MQSKMPILLGVCFLSSLIVNPFFSTGFAQQPVPSETAGKASWALLLDSADRLAGNGKFEEAAVAIEHALELQEKELGADDPLVGKSMLKLGAVCIQAGELATASAALGYAQKIFVKAYGPNSVQVSDVLVDQAALQLRQGSTENVESLYQRALAIRKASLGADDPLVARTAYDLAQFFQDHQMLAKAAPLYQLSLAIREKTLATDNLTLRLTLARYACVMRKTNQVDFAAVLEKRAGFGPLPERPKRKNAKLSQPMVEVDDAAQSKLINLAWPVYPLAARTIAGAGKREVRVELVIDPAGTVVSACADSGPSVFWENSEYAARRSVFTPTLVNGTPTAVIASIWYVFAPNEFAQPPGRNILDPRNVPQNPFDGDIPRIPGVPKY